MDNTSRKKAQNSINKFLNWNINFWFQKKIQNSNIKIQIK
jgi:hypothetical protein